MDRAVKQSNSQLSLSQRHHHHHQNAGRSVFSKRSRYNGSNPNHHFSQQEQQQQQSSSNHSSSSSNSNNTTSRGNKRTPFSDQNQKFSFKLGGRWNSHQGHNSEGIERMIYQTERIRASPSLAERIISSDASSMVCALCNDLLGHNPENHRPRSSGLLLIEEPCVVAVLVCGHAFHADCLERATLVKDARDPPCPSCSCWSAKAQDA